jgi:hypothetical protein
MGLEIRWLNFIRTELLNRVMLGGPDSYRVEAWIDSQSYQTN